MFWKHGFLTIISLGKFCLSLEFFQLMLYKQVIGSDKLSFAIKSSTLKWVSNTDRRYIFLNDSTYFKVILYLIFHLWWNLPFEAFFWGLLLIWFLYPLKCLVSATRGYVSWRQSVLGSLQSLYNAFDLVTHQSCLYLYCMLCFLLVIVCFIFFYLIYFWEQLSQVVCM